MINKDQHSSVCIHAISVYCLNEETHRHSAIDSIE